MLRLSFLLFFPVEDIYLKHFQGQDIGQTDRQMDGQTDAGRHFIICSPVRTRGVKSRMCPPYPQRVVKGN